MFECAKILLIQVIEFIPFFIALWLCFDWLGSMFFGAK